MNGYMQYKEQSISTMTQGELLLRLYDELQKRLLRAQFALEQENYPLFEQSVARCKDIVTYLTETLDYQYPISQNLRQLYDFFQYELARLLSGRRQEVIQELKPLIEELKGAFEEADRKESGNMKLEGRFQMSRGKKG